MKRIKHLTLVLPMVFVFQAAGLTGCSKTVEVTFTNIASTPVEVQLNGPGEGTGLLGSMGAGGGRIFAEVKVSKSSLPAHYAWNAGPFTGGFVISKKSPKKLWIDVGSGRGARDKHTEINERKEKTRTVITQEEVVTGD